jgi:hypothetical protein
MYIRIYFSARNRLNVPENALTPRLIKNLQNNNNDDDDNSNENRKILLCKDYCKVDFFRGEISSIPFATK